MYSGKRSKEASERRLQRKAAKDFVWTLSFNDFLIGESICRSDPEEVAVHLEGKFGFCDMSAVPTTFKGVVISDSYGNGAFQMETKKQ